MADNLDPDSQRFQRTSPIASPQPGAGRASEWLIGAVIVALIIGVIFVWDHETHVASTERPQQSTSAAPAVPGAPPTAAPQTAPSTTGQGSR